MNIKKNFDNLPIYKKLLLMISVLTITLLTFSMISIHITFQSNQKLLYSAVSSLMNNSAVEISDQISTAIDMTRSMLSNQKLQEFLSEIKDSPSEHSESSYINSYQELSKILYDYYYIYPNDNISSIILTNSGNFTLSTYNKGKKLPSNIIKKISDKAMNDYGGPVLITDYAKEYGLILARSIRRKDPLKLDALGAIIVNFNISSLISEATDTISLTENVSYVLREEDSTTSFYNSSDTSICRSDWLDFEKYSIRKLNKQKYFIVKGNIPSYHWEYLCLINYDTIFSSISHVKLYCILLIFLSALTIFFVSKKLIYSLTCHLHVLVEKMVAFGKNDSVIPKSAYDYSNRTDEIGTLHNQFNHMAYKIQTLINENYKNELLKKDMMLKNLQNQINPHFLYNTLESINWRAKISGEKEISQMVQALGSLLRTSLSPKSFGSCVRSEMQIVHNYITIQKLRFEDRLSYTEKVSPEVMDIEIPLLIIQPLVENATRYGLEANIGTCIISVEIYPEHDKLLIKILNGGSQFEDGILEKLLSGAIISHGFGIGILNIHKRIQLLYGKNYGIKLINPDEDHALSEITLPIKTKTGKEESDDEITDCR